MIENKHIRSFLRVLDLGSFSKAAKSLNIAQPALSQHVRKLEDALGTRLLDRSAHGVSATANGRDFSTHARQILTLVDRAERRYRRGADEITGEIRLGLPGSVCPVLAPPLMLAAAQKYPGVRLQIFELMSGDLAEYLREGRADIAVLFNVQETEDYTSEALLTERLHLIGAAYAPLVQGETVGARQLADVPLVGTRPPHGLRLVLERWSSDAGITLNFRFEADAPSVLVRLASEGSCYSIVSKAAIAHEVLGGSIRAAEIVDPPIQRTVCLASSKRLPPDKARNVVVDLTRDAALELVSCSKWAGASLVTGAR
ncbi:MULTISPECIES: LysR family transcriptional regulator [unclassified Mameliella]|uniref:LysR family transcriptional regulator n=1 Tax=unclassified Mameliella TaxID=2630630 RepID=UPI00273EAF69|nr:MULTISPECIES: LysR family transcriptional regulator [unclassified Mameliella]